MQQPTSLAQLNSIISDAGSKPVVAKFYGSNCPACVKAAPAFQTLSDTHSRQAVFADINCEEATDAAQHHQIRSIPTFIIWCKGIKVDTIIGADMAKLTAAIESAISSSNVFSAETGNSMLSGTSSAVPTGQRRNPWADPNFHLVKKAMGSGYTAPAVKPKSDPLEAEREVLDWPQDGNGVAEPGLLEALVDMEFPEEMAAKALRATNSKDVDTAVQWIIAQQEGEPDMVAPEAVDDATVELIKTQKLEKKNKLHAFMDAPPDKPLSEMTKEEKLEYVDKMKEARRKMNLAEEKLAARAKEERRRERVKGQMATKEKRAQEELERAAKAKRKEKKLEKERRAKIKAKIAETQARKLNK